MPPSAIAADQATPQATAPLWWAVALVVGAAMLGAAATASPSTVPLEIFVEPATPGGAPGGRGAAEPAEPALLVIPSIGVRADVVPVGLHRDGTLETPPATEAGWYRHGTLPGRRGSAVIAGHVDSRSAPGVFAALDRLRPGAVAGVRDTEGVWTLFRVHALSRHPKDRLPPAVWAPGDRRLLRLITCGGVFDSATGHYRDNVVAHAVALGRWRPPPEQPAAEPPWPRVAGG
ncbi:MAG TPA: sortase [Egibacteraceae bacterium]|nr:sortase [Egibacteraceae bacterium]